MTTARTMALLVLAAGLGMVLLRPGNVKGQGGYQLARAWLGSGGEVLLAGGEQERYQERGSAGGWAVGGLAGAAHNGSSGFWWPIRDADGDGLPDRWEQTHGVTDPAGDPDGDGLDNLGEYQAVTDPNLADSDGDGAGDGAEVDAGTDPLDPTSTPGGPAARLIYLPVVFK